MAPDSIQFTREDLTDIAEIKSGQATMNGKLDLILSNQEKVNKTIYGDDGAGGLCGRMSRLESFQAAIMALAGTVSLAVSVVGSWVLSHFKVA